MSTWSEDDLNLFVDTEELRIASIRADGTLRPFVIIWMVVVDGELYVRSAGGPENGWFRRAVASGGGRVEAGGVEHDVTWVLADDAPHEALDTAYHAKYDPVWPQYVAPVVGATAASATLRVTPA